MIIQTIPAFSRGILNCSSLTLSRGSKSDIDEVSAAKSIKKKKTAPDISANDPNLDNANGMALKTNSWPCEGGIPCVKVTVNTKIPERQTATTIITAVIKLIGKIPLEDFR